METRVATVPVRLEASDESMLAGSEGQGVAMAMRIVTRLAEIMGADHLLDISGAHIDSCLYHGRSGLDFAERILVGGARVRVPTTLNVSSLDLLHPELYRGDPQLAVESRQLMDLYEQMGCRPTWTCAPYQLEERPAFGQHVAWAESNAIVFANSVLGARTHRYGDFIDICAAMTGRAPAAGLHLDENRAGQHVFVLEGLTDELLTSDVIAPVLGYLIGQLTGTRIPVVVGLPESTPEHRLKALGAASASSGGVGMFHAVGITPEAPELETALHGQTPAATTDVTASDLRAARDALTSASSEDLGAVSLGTPHYSVAEFGRLVELLNGRRIADGIDAYVNTGRDVWLEVKLRGWDTVIVEAGFQVVTDTCTYITPVMKEVEGVAMTDSAKWAHYAPGNIGVEVVFGSVEDCVESAVHGRIVHQHKMWRDS